MLFERALLRVFKKGDAAGCFDDRYWLARALQARIVSQADNRK